ncbi:hypothetical protein FD755_024279, partial [Muntiacus reevesi]
IVSGLTFRSLIHFEFIFVYAPLVKEVVFFPLYILASFVEDKVSIAVIKLVWNIYRHSSWACLVSYPLDLGVDLLILNGLANTCKVITKIFILIQSHTLTQVWPKSLFRFFHDILNSLHILFPLWLSQDIEYSLLCYTVGPCCLFILVVFVDIFIMNLILWIEGSSSAISFGTLIGILALWFGISVPLTFLGAYVGSFQKFDYPVSINLIPRQIPHQAFIRRPFFSVIIGGVLPFGCIFIQLFFILNSIWSHQMYIMFGFLFLVFIILLITCSEATILLCYFHLCSEDYHWWWRAFLTSSFTAVYFFAYAVYYFFAELKITGIASTILYFGYTMIMVLIFFLFTGFFFPRLFVNFTHIAVCTLPTVSCFGFLSL